MSPNEQVEKFICNLLSPKAHAHAVDCMEFALKALRDFRDQIENDFRKLSHEIDLSNSAPYFISGASQALKDKTLKAIPKFLIYKTILDSIYEWEISLVKLRLNPDLTWIPPQPFDWFVLQEMAREKRPLKISDSLKNIPPALSTTGQDK